MENRTSEPEEIDGPYWISVRVLVRHIDPFKDDVWGDGPISKTDVKKAIDQQNFADTPYFQTNQERNDATPEERKDYDIRRVAYMVVNPQEHPIELDISRNGVGIEDGCHRLASAIYRRETHILAHYSGYMDEFHRVFGHTMITPEQPAGLKF